jgi:hypothetical protein
MSKVEQLKALTVVASLLMAAGCGTGTGGLESRLSLRVWSSHAQLSAWNDTAILITPVSSKGHRVRALSSDNGLVWERSLDCGNSDVLSDGLLCIGKRQVVALSGKDGGNLWSWDASTEIGKVQYEGARVTLEVQDGTRHTLDTANGHAVAPGPVASTLFTSGGSLSITMSKTAMRARRYGNGEEVWTSLSALWPAHDVLLHQILFQGVGADGGPFFALVDSESRLILSQIGRASPSAPVLLKSTPDGVLVVQDASVTALRRTHVQTHPTSPTRRAWALGRTSLISIESQGGDTELIWKFVPPKQRIAIPTFTEDFPVLSRPGLTFHGAWVNREGALTHLEVRVKRWSPDLLYAWRTDGPWTARRMSPEASGDRGLTPSFDGEQPFSPMPLWFSPSTVSELKKNGRARVGKLNLMLEGWSYHRLLEQRPHEDGPHSVSVPVMVVERPDTGNRYWIAPNGANPILLRAERADGLFYLAGMVRPEEIGR